MPVKLERINIGAYKIPIYLIALAIIGVNILLKLIGITTNEIALDEPFTLFHAQRPISEITELSQNGNNPPLYMYFMHYWTDWFGVDPFWSRLPSLVFSSITAGLVFLIGKELKFYRAGLFAAGLYTVSSLNLTFAHEARMYAMLTLLYAFSILFLIRLTNKPNTKNNFLFILTCVLAFYTHYLAGIMWITFLSIGILYRDKIGFKRIILSTLAIVLLSLPAILMFVNRTSVGAGNAWLEGNPTATSLYNLIWAYSNSPVAAVASLVLIIVSLTISNKTRPKLFIHISWLLPVLAAFIISFNSPIFMSRYLVFASIGFYLALGFAIEGINIKKYLKLIIACVLLTTYTFSWNSYTDNDRELKEICEMIEEDKTDQNIACVMLPDFVSYRIAYHLERPAFEQAESFVSSLESSNYYIINSRHDISREMTSYNSLIVIDALATPEEEKEAIYDVLVNHYGLPVRTYSTKGYLYSLYNKGAKEPAN